MKQAEALAQAVSKFGATAKDKLGGDGQPEDQLRNPLETLVTDIAEEFSAGKIALVGEHSLAELHTRPDFAVERIIKSGRELIGFIEVKAPGKGTNPKAFKDKHDKDQWAKLKSLPNLIYTDGNGFSLWQNGDRIRQVKLEGDIEEAGAKLAAPAELLQLFNDFLTWNPIPPKNVKELARVSARLCRFLRDEVIEQLGVKNAKLTALKEDWKKLLFPEADDARFADGYAQAVTFGLLMAKSRNIDLSDGLYAVSEELGQTNTLIGTALRLLTEQKGLELGPALDTLTRVLDVVVWQEVSKGDPEAWLYFYEDFLEVYDNTLRKATGSYYTPPEVVQTMVRLCDEALRSADRFAIADGLADNQVHIADPATGSGTFLLAVLRSIRDTVQAKEGEGAVAARIEEAAKRLYGFELQFGAFAVAQLRLFAEMIELGAEGHSPQLFVTNTLADPHADFESGTGIYKEISESRRAANKVKLTAPITVVIGNPPYKRAATGKGAWIENGSGNRPAPLNDWQPPKKWGVGTDAKNLRNLYVYFWRWAAWKVFEQGTGARDKEPPIEEALSGIVCYITVAGFLNGPGFQKMRSDLREQCDEIWVIDCSPEGHQPKVATRIFEDVQQPICIVIASRSPDADRSAPAKLRFRKLHSGHRTEKFKELSQIKLLSDRWTVGARDWRAPFLPEHSADWSNFPAIENIVGDVGLGSMAGRVWIITPDRETLSSRWNALTSETDKSRRAVLFHPHMRKGKPGDKHIEKAVKSLGQIHDQLPSVESLIRSGNEKKSADGKLSIPIQEPIRYGFRSFDRQWIIPDNRLINQPSPDIWNLFSGDQIYLTALSRSSPKSGPAASLTALIPDHDHYKGSASGRVFPLWKDAEATEPNINSAVVCALAKAYGSEPDPVDVFAYVAAVLAHPAFTETFRDDLVRPGLRVPLTADAKLFAEAAALGRRVIWLHTFGERFADPDTNPPRPAGEPRLTGKKRLEYPKAGAIPTTPEGFPDGMRYNAAERRLHVGTGYIDNVPPAVWDYEVSGKNVLTQWFSYRKKDRSRPIIGDRREPSPLGKIQPDHWLPEYTSELLNVINVLALLTELEPAQADLLRRIVDGPLIPASKIEGA